MSILKSKSHNTRGGKKKKREFPHVLALLFYLIVFISICTYIIPAGTYDRIVDPDTGREIVDPTSYHLIESNPTSFLGIFAAIPKGLNGAAWIMFLVFLIGGSFKVIMSTGALQALMGKTLKKADALGTVFIPVLMLVFGIMSSFMSNTETYIAYIPMTLVLAKALGYDSIIGVAIVLMGINAGFTAGMYNPFTTGIAHNLIGLPEFSGSWFRWISFFVFYGVNIFFTLRYAKKVKEDPTNSLVYHEDLAKNQEEEEFPELDSRLKVVLIVFAIGLGYAIYSILNDADFKTEIPGIFLMTAIATGLIAGYKPNQIAEEFLEGCRGVLLGAFVIGFARAISVVMTEAHIIDTIVHSTTNMLAGLPKTISAVLMLYIQVLINCFITSGSGQAATTIPIMSPIGDILGFTQQTVTLAFQFGDGLINQLLPTSGTTMAILALADIPFPKWFKFVWKMILVNLIAAGILIGIAAAIDLGPF